MDITLSAKKNLGDILHAPVLIKNDIFIEVSVHKLFLVLENAETWPCWSSLIKHVAWVNKPPVSLSSRRIVEAAWGIIGNEAVVAWEPDKRMAFSFIESSMPYIKGLGSDYELLALGGARVHLVWRIGVWPKDKLSDLWFRALTPLLRLIFKRQLVKLKQYVERHHQ